MIHWNAQRPSAEDAGPLLSPRVVNGNGGPGAHGTGPLEERQPGAAYLVCWGTGMETTLVTVYVSRDRLEEFKDAMEFAGWDVNAWSGIPAFGVKPRRSAPRPTARALRVVVNVDVQAAA